MLQLPSTKDAILLTILSGFALLLAAHQGLPPHGHHPMQHGFILGSDDRSAAHLVATGHHSRQVVVKGRLFIPDSEEAKFYQERKPLGGFYFVLQAQNLDLPSVRVGMELQGHIIESRLSHYDPQNRVVSHARFVVERVLVNVENPFFID